ncbi:sulfite reductase flavoprotein subunit alpha [Dyella sp. C9]|uniref:sulfite reductase subunit alpha n=1 Tax=Dyella sp. C9 TaxID=2202154 RepID=UPI000DEECA0B|nr:sulfite reductase flavoprotein subunit alpha [Dyella sp. C9]
MSADGHTRPAWGNPVLGVVLALTALALLWLHRAEWEWHDPGASRWLAAGLVLLAWVGFTAAIALRRRGMRALRVDVSTAWPEDALLVVFASQTGTAEQWALQTMRSLEQAGMAARLQAMGDLNDVALMQARRVLFLVSTTGEGDAPDGASGFVTRWMQAGLSLGHLRYGLLALGDRDYANFCGFGRELRHWLQHNGATPLFDTVEVDNGDPAALRHWQHHLARLSGVTEMPDWERPDYQRWQLVERQWLNPGSVGGPCFHLALRPLEGMAEWQAGDLVEIGPRHAASAVEEWLARTSLVAGELVSHQGRTDTLGEWLAASHLPPSDEVPSLTAAALVGSLQALPHREYSIASLPSDGTLQLLVRRVQREDGSAGVGSGWLTEHAPLGATIALRIRGNASFRVPASDAPLILIGNGTGLAGLRALLKARIAAGYRRNWLLFGERQQAHDFHHRAEIEQWLQEGQLERLDLAWSRDGTTRVYVQDRLRGHADLLRDWVGQGATVCVCGSLDGMAPGVDAVLREVLGDEATERLREDGRYRRDVY